MAPWVISCLNPITKKNHEFLPDSSKKYYPNNTLTNFTTRLHSTIDLSGQWYVGLAEMSFPKSWYNVPLNAGMINISCTEAQGILLNGSAAYVLYNLEIKIPTIAIKI